MRLLLDQGLPRSTVDVLANAGIDAEHVADLGLSAATDADILDAAVQRDAVVVSLDSDFHALLAARGASSPSVVRIRIEGLSAEPLAALLGSALKAIQHELETGAVASVTEKNVRVRSLPIGKKAR